MQFVFFSDVMLFKRWEFDILELKEKKKNLIEAISGLVRMKGYLEIYNPNFWGGFQAPNQCHKTYCLEIWYKHLVILKLQ